MSPEVRTEEWRLVKHDKNTQNVGKPYPNLHFMLCICYTRKSFEGDKSFGWLLHLLQIKSVFCFIFESCCHHSRHQMDANNEAHRRLAVLHIPNLKETKSGG